MGQRVIILNYAIHSTLIFQDAKGNLRTRCVIEDSDFAKAKLSSDCSWTDDVAVPADYKNEYGNQKSVFHGEPFNGSAPKDLVKEVVK